MKQLLIFIFLLVIAGALLYVYYQNSPYSKGIERTPFGKLESMVLKSDAFSNGQKIPAKYTCDAENISPPFSFFTVPVNAKSLTLIIEDTDSLPKNFTHWIVSDIDPFLNGIGENFVPESAVEGLNDFSEPHYGGLCPNSGTHHYIFKLYALDTKPGLEKGYTKQEILNKMQGHILDESQIIGIYKKN